VPHLGEKWLGSRSDQRSHHAYQMPGHAGTINVPVHGNDDLKPGTQHGIMKDAGLTEDDL
jgi:predicted RNA binding protein YcfA (HicA-like mRNA interferase family)